MLLFATYVGIGTLSVAFGLTMFQYVILPIANGIVRVKELIDERERDRERPRRV